MISVGGTVIIGGSGGGLPSGGTATQLLRGDETWASRDSVVGAALGSMLSAEPAGTAIVADGAGGIDTRFVPTDAIALGTAYTAGTANAIYVDAVPAPADAFGPGRTLVYLFRSLGTLGAANILAMHADTTTTVARGWHLRAGDDAGARGELSLLLAGLAGSAVVPLPGADFTGADGVHCLAVAITAPGVVRYSWDGGAVATIAALAGTYAPAQAADPWRIGSSCISGGGFAATTVQPIALRTYSTVLSDADLVAVAAERTSYRLAAPSAGTLTTDLAAAQFRGAATVIERASGQRWRLVGALLVHEQS